jgi:anaerobic magnesium-protoporphyrin IX monomethyl ester cyclase
MADVILVKLEQRESELERYSYAPPFGILYLASALENAGFSVKLVHREGTKANIEELAALVANESPLLVGLSTLTGPTILPTVEASQAIRRKSRVPIVWGGHHPTIVPEETLRNKFVDVVVLGEGEETIVDVARTIRESGLDPQNLSRVPGIGFKHGGDPVLTALRPFIKDLDSLAPAWHHLDLEAYFYSERAYRVRGLGKMKVGTVITSRGCPWRCTYCYNQKVNRRVFRAQSVERSVRDVLELKDRYGVNGIVFEDDNFFTDQDRGLEIVRRVEIPWSASFRARDIARGGRDFLKELKASQCLELRIGAESGSPRMLNVLKKDLTVDEIREAARLCEEHEITATFMFMVGFPGETWEDICLTLDMIDELSAMSRYVMVTQLGSYTPYPGTVLFDEAVKQGFVPPGSTAGWGTFVQAGYREYRPPYVDKRAKSLTYYQQLISRKDLEDLKFSLPARLLQRLARLRWKHRYFAFSLDHSVPVFLQGCLEKAGLFSLSNKLYKK